MRFDSMGWTHYILASAFFLAIYDLFKKAGVRNNAVLPTLLCSSVFGCVAFSIAALCAGSLPPLHNITWQTTTFAAVKTLIVSTSWIFTFTALRTLPVSIATPIRAGAPGLVFLLALVLYGEIPSPLQAVGMLLIAAGYFAFSWAGRCEGIDFLRNRAVWCAFAGTLCSAFSSLWDKYIFQIAKAPVETVQLLFQVFLVAVYAIVTAYSKWGGKARESFQWRWSIPMIGILLVFADWLYFTGLSFADVPVSAASLLRRASVIVTFSVGAVIFKEKNIPKKAIALTTVLAGVALICIAG